MLKNNKFKLSFSTEVILILAAFLLQIISDIASIGYIDGCRYSIYLLLFIAFGMYYTEAKGGILLSIAFFIKFEFEIKWFVSTAVGYIVKDIPMNPSEVFDLVMSVACIISNIVFILYGLNKIKNIKICYIFIGLLLLNSSVSVINAINKISSNSAFTFSDAWWLLSNISDLLIHIAVLIYLLPSKKKKYIENKKQQSLL